MPGIKKIIFTVGCLLIVGVYFAPSEAREQDASGRQPVQSARVNAKFPHGEKRHSELDCAKCHRVTREAPFDVKDPNGSSAYPGHASCTSCHNFALMFFTRPQFCWVCHDGRPVSKSQPALFDRVPKSEARGDFGIDFSHVNHRKDLPQNITINRFDATPIAHFGERFLPGASPKCTECHEELKGLRTGMKDMNTAKGHGACFVCHGDIPASGRIKSVREFPYMNDCRECHELGGPRSPHLFDNYPVRGFRHDDHDYDIRPRTKAQIRAIKAEDRLCSECHSAAAAAESLRAIRLPEENHCNECHNGNIGLPDPLETDVLETLRKR
ncbi:MAG: hypothetical protein L0229_13610 [Blastocatellia bacterium]|nr:hypothetical protein [Blastocatellia bacterium]